MTKADRYMFEAINNILENGYKDINPRPKYADGTPAHTISVNHTFRTYDLSKGEFPICTLRPQAWKTGIREIFTIYQKPTNEIAKMEEMGVNCCVQTSVEMLRVAEVFTHEKAVAHLKDGGVFLAVMRRQHGAESAVRKLTELFGNCAVTDRDKGFWILRAVK